MSSIAFCSKCGKNELDTAEFTNIDGDTICKECWLAENPDANNNNNNCVKTISLLLMNTTDMRN